MKIKGFNFYKSKIVFSFFIFLEARLLFDLISDKETLLMSKINDFIITSLVMFVCIYIILPFSASIPMKIESESDTNKVYSYTVSFASIMFGLLIVIQFINLNMAPSVGFRETIFNISIYTVFYLFVLFMIKLSKKKMLENKKNSNEN